MTRTFRMLAATAIASFAVMVALADGPVAPVVSGVEVRAMDDGAPVEASHAYSCIGTKPGMMATPEAVAKDVKALLASRIYSSVLTKFEDDGSGGSRLVFMLSGRNRLSMKPIVAGNDYFRTSKIVKLSGLEVGAPIDQGIVDAAAGKIRKEYERRNFYDVTVTGTVIPARASPGGAFVKFTIKEGKRLSVPLISFNGNEKINDAHLRKTSNQYSWWNPTGWFVTPRVSGYDLEIVRSDARRQYADLGYLDATVSAPKVVDANGRRTITYDVKEGRRYYIGGATVKGCTIYRDTFLLGISGLRKDSVASISAIERAQQSIRDYYVSNGYMDTTVKMSIVPDAAAQDRINIHFIVSEGRLVNIRNIVVRGNSITKDKVIRREIPLNPGDKFDDVVASRSETRLKNLGYFSTVRHHAANTDDPLTRDLIYEVEEQPTGNLQIGAGFSSADHLMGFFEVSQSNFDLFNAPRFKGAGQQVRLGFRISDNSKNVELSFIEPWFMDRRLALNVDAYLREHSYSEYDEQVIGGAVGLSRHVPWVGRLGLVYSFEKVSLDDVIDYDYVYLDDLERHFKYTDENDDYLLGSMRLNWTYDTRDTGLIPTSGTRARASAILYSEAFGGDYNMYELTFNVRHYIPTFWGHVVCLYLRTQVIDSLDSDVDVPIGNRYFLGGNRDVRGFKYRAISPKVRATDPRQDPRSYRPVGGNTLLSGSVEYNIPVSKFFRLGAFWDAGNVWQDSFDYDFSEYASSVGGGIRLDIPSFPIRIDYAVPIRRDDDYSKEARWVFWVGFD